MALCAVSGLILNAWLKARTDGKESPGLSWPETTLFSTASMSRNIYNCKGGFAVNKAGQHMIENSSAGWLEKLTKMV
jgi:hypothetical protein